MTQSRDQEVGRIRRRLERLHSPRLQMMLIVALTAAVGFLASVLLLACGLESMWLRYPAAVGIAYLAFLFFLWCWLKLRWDDYIDVPDLSGLGSGSGSGSGGSGGERVVPWEGGGGGSGGGGASGSFGGSSAGSSLADTGSPASSGMPSISADVFDLEELAVVIIAIVALAAALLAGLWVVWTAPALFAELLLDAALSTGLYRRLRRVEGDHWLRTAVRRTIWPMLGVALVFAIAGAVMQAYAPAAKSIGHVFHQMREK